MPLMNLVRLEPKDCHLNCTVSETCWRPSGFSRPNWCLPSKFNPLADGAEAFLSICSDLDSSEIPWAVIGLLAALLIMLGIILDMRRKTKKVLRTVRQRPLELAAEMSFRRKAWQRVASIWKRDASTQTPPPVPSKRCSVALKGDGFETIPLSAVQPLAGPSTSKK